MVTNILYAYLENIQAFSCVFSIVLLLFLIFLAIIRIGNDVDRDDWQILMKWTIPLLIFFSFLTMMPGMEHIKEVNKRFIELSIEPKPMEKTNETIYYPSADCTSVSVCR